MKVLGLNWYHQKEKETWNRGSDPEWCASSEAGKCALETIWKRAYSSISLCFVRELKEPNGISLITSSKLQNI